MTFKGNFKHFGRLSSLNDQTEQFACLTKVKNKFHLSFSIVLYRYSQHLSETLKLTEWI